MFLPVDLERGAKVVAVQAFIKQISATQAAHLDLGIYRDRLAFDWLCPLHLNNLYVCLSLADIAVASLHTTSLLGRGDVYMEAGIGLLDYTIPRSMMLSIDSIELRYTNWGMIATRLTRMPNGSAGR